MSRSRDTADWGQFKPVRENLLINGGFDIWQRGIGFSNVAGGTVTADRWYHGKAGTGEIGVDEGNLTDIVGGANKYLSISVDTADTSLATGDTYIMSQRIEGYNIAGLGWGSVSARSITLSFYSAHTKTGIYCISMRSSGAARSYVVEYTQSVASAWEKHEITIPGDTAGTWLTDNGLGISVDFIIANGTQRQGAAETWLAADAISTSNQVNAMDSVSNVFRITAAKVEVGDEATDFEYRHFGEELELCQRYYQKFVPVGIGGFANGVNIVEGGFMLPVTLRDNPTVSMTGTARFHDVTGTITSSSAAISPQTANTSSLWFRQTGFSGLTSGNSGVIDFNGNAVEFDAEL